MASRNGVKYELTADQRQTLGEEIASDPKGLGYAGCTRGGVVERLNRQPQIANPVPQGQVDAAPVSLGKAAGRLTADEYLAIVASPTGQAILQVLPEVGLTSRLAAELMQRLVLENLISQDRLKAIFDAGKIPDPTWQAKISGRSRTEKLLVGDGWKAEGDDITLARVEHEPIITL